MEKCFLTPLLAEPSGLLFDGAGAGARFGHLAVLVAAATRDPNSPDNFSVHDDWHAAINGNCPCEA